MIVTAGSANVSAYFYIVQDAGNTSPGEPLTGLLYSDIETGGSASYMRQGAARVDLTLITQTVAGAHSDGGFIEVDATNMPGVYRCDYPDAAFLTGVDQVILQLVVASAKNAVVAPLMVDITDVNLRDTVRAGLTALPNAAADAAGGLAISDAGGLDLDALNTAAVRLTATRAQVLDDWINAGRLDAILDLILADTGELQTNQGNWLTITGHATATSLATAQTDLDTITGSDGVTLATAQALYAPAKAGDNMGSASSVTGAVGSVTAAVTANTTQIAGSTTAATNLSASAAGIITGTTSGTPTTTSTNTDLTAYEDSELVGRVIIFTGGTANGEASDITAYTKVSGVVTYTALATAPAASDSFVIV